MFGQNIFFISDRGNEERMNLWKYNITNKRIEQITSYKDFDIHFPSLGNGDIVFEQGGKLHLYNIASKSNKTISVNITSDMSALMPRSESVEDYIQNVNISPDGKRILIESRGDVFSLPAKEGVYLKPAPYEVNFFLVPSAPASITYSSYSPVASDQ